MEIPAVLNIPHSSWEIPEKEFNQFIATEWQLIYEHLVLVDWFTDELFGISGARLVRAPFSRILVDTEKNSADVGEAVAAHGMGAIYTHGSQGQQIRRELSPLQRQKLLDDYYIPHHERLESAIQSTLKSHGRCLLIDCHSFPNEPFKYKNFGEDGRPDFCIGITRDNTPHGVVEKVAKWLSETGYTAEISLLSEGGILPKMVSGNNLVGLLRIGVNRRLYMQEQSPPYSPEVFSKDYLPRRSGRFWDIKRVIRELVYEALGIQYAGPPDDQLNMSRFMRETASGEVSAEMQAWWQARH